ncbi:hypothetical protein GUJ93_ZPchr0012g21028 [Zizania palustris]|uniref:DUF1308 domain-containing protein n=1 Tax=Zizania palustris TaxID=103762 RepID=A0A8J5WLV4_ZIZPA|nr:hypothetical protein GUJ93_ZPchr0012g21467 [Zizania palustris]KAG8092071.1 hypothetical protein GUJ93_ZPchr0012g21028 [Zizania palustris]
MAAPPASDELELARARCRELHDRVAAYTVTLPRQPALRSLLRLVAAELRFLDSSRPDHAAAAPRPLSSNLPHLAALHVLLTHPAVRCPSRLAPLPGVDFACAFRSRPAWALLSARNPSRLAWDPAPDGLRSRVAAALDAARRAPPATRPEKLLLVFSRGVGADPARGLAEEFGAVEIDLLVDFVGEATDDDDEGWVSVNFSPNEDMRSFKAFEIVVAEGGNEIISPPPPLQEVEVNEGSGKSLEGEFGNFVGRMRMGSKDLMNLDTTALIAIVSGISNGGVEKLMSIPEAETRARFKCNYKFVIDQAHSELQSPVLVELGEAVDGKRCIICETVISEFKEIVSMCGGPEEKTRSSQLLKRLIAVPDSPSARMMDLPTTRKLAMKNKVVFGTGDHWRAPTLTANMGFVRAVSQSGMPLVTIEHRPRALIGL